MSEALAAMIDSVPVRQAAVKAFCRFRYVPGCLIDKEDFRQEAALALLRHGVHDMTDGMLYTIAIRRMIDFGRTQMACTRSEQHRVAAGGVPAMALFSLDELMENGTLDAWMDTTGRKRSHPQLD